jgi:uncharacterized protein (TIGR02145 family)
MKNKSLVMTVAILAIVFNSYGQETGILTDSRDGKTFKTVKIGTQTWMTENLFVNTFTNGDTITQAKTIKEWKRLNKDKIPCWIYSNEDKHERYYNWVAVNDPRGLAPMGFHIPKVEEWILLTHYLGNEAGKKLKSTSGWSKWYYIPAEYGAMPGAIAKANNLGILKDGNGTNESRFSGCKNNIEMFNEIFSYYKGFITNGEYSIWWSSSVAEEMGNGGNKELAYCFYLENNSDKLNSVMLNKRFGMSVRCIMD